MWLATSVAIAISIACKSKEKSKVKDPEPAVMEHPKPVMESQTDSLKKVLDEKRRLRKGH
ncbi:MAG: hypothetical protein V4651_00840 [Bacteroidota bacterium]